MSGGLDSSVAAALLKEAGFNVIGAFMKFWSEPGFNGLIGKQNKCCSPEAQKRARLAADVLGIPFYVFNFEKEFKKKVVDYFLNEIRKGLTPNPCVICNKEIKFGLFLKKALSLGADFIATGHYARTNRDWKNLKKYSGGEKFKLLMAKDKTKDQSYFLWQLNQKQLKYILFPIGDYTKNQVKKMAKKFKLPIIEGSESQEICFIRTTLNDFLKEHLKLKKGKIVDVQGKILGWHQGLPFYTIGQRKGIGLPGGPYYVLGKNLKKNLLVVTRNKKDLYKKELVARNVNWVLGKIPKLPIKVKAKIRYRHNSAIAEISREKKIRNISYFLKSLKKLLLLVNQWFFIKEKNFWVEELFVNFLGLTMFFL